MTNEFKILRDLTTIDSNNPENDRRHLQIELPPELTEDKYRWAIAKLLQDERNGNADPKIIEILEFLQEAIYTPPKK